MAGIYVHTPFCKSKCIYCGFYSTVDKKFREKLVPALTKEICERRNFFSSQCNVKSLYFGGGTPSVLTIAEIDKIISEIKNNFSFYPDSFSCNDPDIFEFTFEVNPDDITKEYASALKERGVNRISMGVQSFNNKHLSWMRRRHTSEDILKAFKILREVGFDNISLDLIFGFSTLKLVEWRENLNRILELSPEHISAYQLSIDDGSFLDKLFAEEKYNIVSQEDSYNQYTILQDTLQEAGYQQYEVSNFSKKRFYSRHNSNYWSGVPYIGFGPSAHSFIGNKRFWNRSNIKDYVDYYNCLGKDKIKRNSMIEEEELYDKDIYNEYIMLSLRMIQGASLSKIMMLRSKVFEAKSEDNHSFAITIERLKERKLLVQDGDKIKIPPEKLFVSDGIIRDLFI